MIKIMENYMKRYFFILPLLMLFQGCELLEPIYFETPKVSQNIPTVKTVDKIKWKRKEEKLEYEGYIIDKSYDQNLKMWKYLFKSSDGGEIKFFYNLKLGYDGDLIKVSLKKEGNILVLDDVNLIIENLDRNRFVESYDSSEKIYKKKNLKKRTLDRLNRKLGVPKVERINIY